MIQYIQECDYLCRGRLGRGVLSITSLVMMRFFLLELPRTETIVMLPCTLND